MNREVVCSWIVALVLLVTSARAWAVTGAQFSTLDPGYQQQIFTGVVGAGEGGFAWTNGGNLLTRTGSVINEYDTAITPNLHLSTDGHAVLTTHAITGLATTGVGMTNGLDGYVYTNTSSGLMRMPAMPWRIRLRRSSPERTTP